MLNSSLLWISNNYKDINSIWKQSEFINSKNTKLYSTKFNGELLKNEEACKLFSNPMIKKSTSNNHVNLY